MPRVIHFDIASSDPGHTIEFYSGVFGWKFERYRHAGVEDYWIINTGDDPKSGINGGMMRSQSNANSGGLGIGVSSVDKYIGKIREYGGKTLSDKITIPGVGYFVDCEDRDGHQFSIIEWEDPDDK